MDKQNFDNFQKILQLKRKSKGRLLRNNKQRIDSITTKRRISPHQADFTSVHHLTTPKPPKDSRGSNSARIFLGPHYYCRRLRRCYRIRAGSLASRKEPLIFPFPILLRSFSTSTRQSSSYLDPCISLTYLSFLFLSM